MEDEGLRWTKTIGISHLLDEAIRMIPHHSLRMVKTIEDRQRHASRATSVRLPSGFSRDMASPIADTHPEFHMWVHLATRDSAGDFRRFGSRPSQDLATQHTCPIADSVPRAHIEDHGAVKVIRDVCHEDLQTYGSSARQTSELC